MFFAVPADLPLTARFVIADERVTVAGTESNDTTVALGATVRFEYPAGVAKHNVSLERPGPECLQTAGAAAGSRGRIVPPDPEAAGWVVECRFPVPGVFHFGSDENGAVHGIVRVANADGTVPTERPPTPATPPESVPGLPGGGAPKPAAPVDDRRAPLRWAAAARQRKTLRVVVTGGAERTRLTVEARARRTDLRAKGKARLVRVGRISRTIGAGARVTVRVPLDARARAALERRKPLRLTVRVTVAGTPATTVVTLRR